MNCRLHACLCVLCMLVFPPETLANEVKSLSVSNPPGFDGAPELEVYSTSGEKWTDVDKTDTSRVAVRLNAECKYEGRGNKAYKGGLSVPGFVVVGDKEPANFLIPHSDTASAVFRWEDGKGQPLDPVQICNDELEKRLAKNPGKTRYHLLADGFRVNYPAGLKATYSLTCKPTGAGFTDYKSKSTMVNARIKCESSPQAAAKIPTDKPKPKRATLQMAKIPPLLKAASFEAEPEVHTGDCPVAVKFNGTLTANRAGTVTYRYVRNDGRKSPEFKLEFGGAGTQKTRAWQTTVSEPKPGATLSAGGSQDPGDIQGWYRLEVLSPEPKGAVTAHYRVMCGADSEAAPPATLRAVPAQRKTDGT
jgi:hypothetical protein